MSHLRLWLAGGLVVLVLGVSGMSALTAQRTPPSGLGGSEVGRYQVVHTGPDGLIMLDTATGELYRATPNDIKPYSAHPRQPGAHDRQRGAILPAIMPRRRVKLWLVSRVSRWLPPDRNGGS